MKKSSFGEIMVGILLFIGLGIVGGLTLMYLFNGIISTTFGIQKITIVQAIGIDAVFSFLNASVTSARNDKSFRELILESYIQSGLYALIGFVIMIFI